MDSPTDNSIYLLIAITVTQTGSSHTSIIPDTAWRRYEEYPYIGLEETWELLF